MELNLAFEKLKKDFLIEPYACLSMRRNNLLFLKKLIQVHAEDFAEAINNDFSHRARYETLLLEIFPTINAINYCLKHLKKWMKPRVRHVSWLFKPSYAYLLPQPLGVVGIMVPWNYPFFLAIAPLAYALTAGNRVMIKISELTPNMGSLLATLIQASELKNSVIVVNGAKEVAQSFTRLPFAHLLFTGSTQVGKLVMREVADNLIPLTLELGGKSPAFVSTTIEVSHFERLFIGKMVNAGQTCIAPDYLLIPDNWEGRIEQLLKKFIQHRYPRLLDNPDYSSIISADHQARLMGLIEDACQKGARLVQIGEKNGHNQKMPFFLLFNVNNTMKVMQEEIFGPILPVISYQTLAQALEEIHSHPNPLVIYYFGSDFKEKEALKKKTLSGALSINDTLTYIAIDSLPFGGVGQSGMGHYHGQEGFDNFSKLKPVFVQRRFTTVQWFYPPHGKLIRFLLSSIAGISLKKKA